MELEQSEARRSQIYFVFSSPLKKKTPKLQHICKPHEQTLKAKACKRAAILLTHPAKLLLLSLIETC